MLAALLLAHAVTLHTTTWTCTRNDGPQVIYCAAVPKAAPYCPPAGAWIPVNDGGRLCMPSDVEIVCRPATPPDAAKR